MISEHRPPTKLNQVDFLSNVNLLSSKSSQLSSATYEYLTQNENITHPKKDRNATSKCVCSPEDPCVNSCLNRITSIECHPKTCPAGNKCKNQQFRNAKDKTEVRPTANKGYGLYAKEPIAAGSFIIEYVGQVIDKTEFLKRFQISRKTEKFYYMAIIEGYYIDAQYKGNESRFINHSCFPNAIATKWSVDKQNRLGIFALKAIAVVSRVLRSLMGCIVSSCIFQLRSYSELKMNMYLVLVLFIRMKRLLLITTGRQVKKIQLEPTVIVNAGTVAKSFGETSK